MRIPLPTVRRRARIEIIPLIDVVFFLLATFVMVSLSMVKNQGIAVNLPRASTAVPAEKKLAATVTITEDGAVYLNKEKMDRVRLKKELARLNNQNPEFRVFINGDEKAYFGDAVELLDEIRTLGITKVSIQTRPRDHASAS